MQIVHTEWHTAIHIQRIENKNDANLNVYDNVKNQRYFLNTDYFDREKKQKPSAI